MSVAVGRASPWLRTAALCPVHGASLAGLLAAHGKDGCAANLWAALEEAAKILAAGKEPGVFPRRWARRPTGPGRPRSAAGRA